MTVRVQRNVPVRFVARVRSHILVLVRAREADSATPPDATNALRNDDLEMPQQFRNRRAFLIWSLAMGFIPPERVTERVLADIQTEARDG